MNEYGYFKDILDGLKNVIILALWTYTTLNNTSLDLVLKINNKGVVCSGFDAIIRPIKQ